MKGLLCLCVSASFLLIPGGPASALIGTIDPVPAATLLLPYFEVDIANAYGVDTQLSINNASDIAVLAHVTVWTDQSVPALDFDLYLTGYDVQKISLHDVFVSGIVPVTASAGQDLLDAISPKGPMSQDLNFASCSSMPFPTPFISAPFRAHLQAWLQGNQSPATGNCAGSKQKDNILRGYVTVDTVNACNLFFPSDWAFYGPFVTFQNVLWGDYVYLDYSHHFAQGGTLVSIEACEDCFVPGDHTFYGRYNGATAADGREPLPTTMAARYWGGPFNSTDFLVWREGNAAASGYNCTLQGPASWYPLESAAIVIFDEQEQPVFDIDCPLGDPTCIQSILIPNEAQRINVAADLLSPFDYGWAILDLRHLATFPVYGDIQAQMWMAYERDIDGLFRVGYDGIPLSYTSGCRFECSVDGGFCWWDPPGCEVEP